MFKRLSNNCSANMARERLRSILAADRLHCSNEEVAQVETEVYHVVSRFFHVKPGQVRTRIIQKPGNDGNKKEYIFIFEATIQE